LRDNPRSPARNKLAVIVEISGWSCGGCLDLGVGIDKRNGETPPRACARSTIPGTHHADKHDRAAPRALTMSAVQGAKGA